MERPNPGDRVEPVDARFSKYGPGKIVWVHGQTVTVAHDNGHDRIWVPEQLRKIVGTIPERNGYQTKDSGERAQFDSGMVRDTNKGKPRFDLCWPKDVPFDAQILTRFAALMARGAKKYKDRNWEKANSLDEVERMYESAARHFFQWLSGEDDEDHAAAVFFNIMAVETTLYKRGISNVSRSDA